MELHRHESWSPPPRRKWWGVPAACCYIQTFSPSPPCRAPGDDLTRGIYDRRFQTRPSKSILMVLIELLKETSCAWASRKLLTRSGSAASPGRCRPAGSRHGWTACLVSGSAKTARYSGCPRPPAAASHADALGRVWAKDRVPRGRPPRHLHGFHHAWLAASRGAADWRAAVGPVAASGRRERRRMDGWANGCCLAPDIVTEYIRALCIRSWHF
jgi:hypothetical protein